MIIWFNMLCATQKYINKMTEVAKKDNIYTLDL